MPVICVPDRLGGLDVRAALRAAGPLPRADLVPWDGSGTPDRADDIELLVLDPRVTGEAELFAALPRLAVLQTLAAGVEGVLVHLPPGVTLCNGRGLHGGATAEWVLAATLAVLREIPAYVRAQDAGEWTPVLTDELADKRVLVVGAGDLGGHVARRMAACDAEVTLVARTARDGVHGTAELPELLPHADIVVIVVPLTAQTAGLVDAAFLAAMPDGALLVNAARGPVAVTDALLAELRSGRLRAALDVADPEPLPPGHPLWDAPGVLITPHVAGRVGGFPRRILAFLHAQLARYVAGEPLANIVTGPY